MLASRLIKASGSSELVDTWPWAMQLVGQGTRTVLKVPYTAFNLGTGAYTIESFINPSSLHSYDLFYGQWGGPSTLNISNLGGNVSIQTSNSGSIVGPSVSNIIVNQFNHVAYVYDGTSYAVYINGIRHSMTANSNSISLSPSSTQPVGVGSVWNQVGYGMRGRMKAVRVTAAARYTGGSITVPTLYLTGSNDPLWSSVNLLLPLQNSYVDISANAHSIVNSGTTFTFGP